MNTPSSSHAILLVEDESLIAMMVEDMLEELGHTTVGPATTVAEALELVSSQLSAALLDVNLGGTPSFPVAYALQKQGVPFAFSTGYDNTDLPDDLKHIPTLQKPYMPEDVARTLGKLLAE